MAQTIRLLSTYDGNPPNTIVTVEDSVAAALLAGGIGATTDLTGGVYRYSQVTVLERGGSGSPSAPFAMRGAQKATVPVPVGYVLAATPSKDAEGSVVITKGDGSTVGFPIYRDQKLAIGPFDTAVTLDIQLRAGRLDAQSITARQANALRESNSVAILGDSIAAQNAGGTAVTAVTNANGTVTLTGSDLRLYPGDIFSVQNHPVAVNNQLRTKVISHVMTGTQVTSVTYQPDENGLYSRSPQSGGVQILIERNESDRGFVNFLKARTGARFKVVGNFAAAGSNSDDALFLVEGALALNPRVVLAQLGTNNVYAKQWSAEVSIASLKKVIDRIVAAGAIPIFGAIIPRSDAANTAGVATNNSAASAARVAQTNRWLKSYLPSVGGYYAETWGRTANGTTFADLTATLGYANAGMLGDGVHPDRPGAVAMSKGFEPPVREVFNDANTPTPSPIYNPANAKTYFGNSLLLGTAGELRNTTGVTTGTVATGARVDNTVGPQTTTCSIVPRTEAVDGDALGNWQRLVITGMTAGSATVFRVALSPPAGWTYGEVLEGYAKVRTSSSATPGSGAPTGITQPDLRLGVQTTLTGMDRAYACGNLNTGVPINEPMLLDLATPPFNFKSQGAAVHGTLDFIWLEVMIYARAANASATVDICWPMINGPQAV